MASLADDPAFVALHESPLQTDFTPKYGHMGTIAGAQDFIVPPTGDSNVCIIVIHEFWGLNNQIKSTAEKLHEDTGYGVVAVDLYGGKVSTVASEAAKLMQSVDEAKANQQLHDTITEVKGSEVVGKGITRIGTLGYCFGGGYSLQTALLNPDNVDACVMYYGYPELDSSKLTTFKAPLLGIFGNKDPRINPALVAKFKVALDTAGKTNYEIKGYDAVHGFANPSNPKHDPAATADAWSKTIAFYKKNLG
jgi:carboxymethylenebutenolidase